ncbi:type II secretion system GspH family protein [Clostridium bornimense]|uniref:type II secretion system protein n=1 Tax=Clostridium bornimense TaxID=1216932 RepID=UPI001C11A854|nr:type II secretion system protein [Clostridium bornimense]MBU5314710.1 type II secretion system GspH family protein [Clostridium bornimense]
MNRKKGVIMIELLLSIAIFLYMSVIVMKVIEKNTKVEMSNKRIKHNMRLLNVIREKTIADNKKDYHIIIPEENLKFKKLKSNKLNDLCGKKKDKYVDIYKSNENISITLYERVEGGYEVYKIKK